MPEVIRSVETVGEAILEMLQLRGVDTVIGGAPTSMIEAFAKYRAQGKPAPRAILTPHEQTAVAMAHGYFAATGRPQAVYLYSTVGTANGVGGIINAARARVPMVILSARSPIAEQRGVAGARDIHVQWSQESYDQAAMVREYVKWDYEIRRADQVADVIDRAFEVAMAEPQGPVYISIPRDVQAAAMDEIRASAASRRITDARMMPDPARLDEAADLLASAENPVIVTSELGKSAAGRAALARLCDVGGFGVLEASPVYSNLDPEHPCHLGYIFASQVSPDLEKADVIFVIESDVPWFTARVTVPDSAKVIQLGIDPFYQRLPMRGFPCDVPLIGHAEPALEGLGARLESRIPADLRDRRIAAHRSRRQDQQAQLRDAIAREGQLSEITPLWANHCISRLLDNDTIVVNEYPIDLRIVQPGAAGSYFGPSHAGGLGWGFGAALGVKAARPDKTVICTLGDGSYYYCVPASCHQIAAAEDLPMLVVVFNNGGWNEVRKSVVSTHPQGWASKANEVPLTRFGVRAGFEKIAEAFGGFGAVVEDPAELLPTLEAALRAVKDEGRHALVNVVVSV
ncbi:thiamine pyrophosphate-requiring protein [Microbaculum marinisediminis]|uniref:Thiamine pyrophosphate-requiring protein n=1 Tax=Microbaculum marinisediminis TaxID=2931392 RepID=A0AAW5R1K9_9HYPH|nr:thiamine pyrophosphate-requiring protein [Microbaculum sp. A6E488]MCT8973704.1 thiamine pyrophosphate-requiring protein [Microbaculum sp. A6E488]